MIRLGAFNLEHKIAEGGMGAVWRAHFRDDRGAVAIKLVRPTKSRAAWALRNEVRAAASLRHPNVIALYDVGEVRRAEAEQSGGLLQRGAPWLAMDLAEGGNLRHHPPGDWAGVSALVSTLLDALAHAHARGVIHRDLKPGNVLFTGNGRRPCLADFGLAHALEDGQARWAGGTPGYMAPEQSAHAPGEIGPWTDLYALGCLTWWLVCGSLPYPVVDQHTMGARRSYAPRFAVPGGLQDWLETMLQVQWPDRYRHAADAAFALGQFHSLQPRSPLPLPVGHAASSETLWPSWSTDPVSQEVDLTQTVPFVSHPSPPIPRDWRTFDVRPTGSTGLGLHGLRPVPLIGREDARNELWDALNRSVKEQRIHAVVLRGPSGVGKTRLARWLCEHANELGAATPVRATHGPMPGPMDGLDGLVARYMGVQDVADIPARSATVLTRLGEDSPREHAALALAMTDTSGQERGLERFAMVRGLLQRASAHRPLVIWLDDVQWGPEAIAFASWLANAAMPALIVATVRDEDVVLDPAVDALLTEWLARTNVTEIPIASLAGEERQQLVEGILPLAAPLAATVAARTNGNPLFAVHLVGDWVERGLLMPSPAGYVLKPDQDLALPTDLRALWHHRIEGLKAEVPSEDAWIGLELAAVLGQEVQRSEWSEACAHADVPLPEALLERLLDLRLAINAGPGVIAFAHGMFREALEQLAEEHGRLRAHHRTAAAVLQTKVGHGVYARLGTHLVQAGLPGEAIHPLLTAVREDLTTSNLLVATQRLRTCERALTAAAPPSDPRWGELWICYTILHRRAWALERAEPWLQRAEAGAHTHGWTDIATIVHIERSQFCKHTGKPEQALTHANQALASIVDTDWPLRWRALKARGVALLDLGHVNDAATALAQGLQAATRAADEVGQMELSITLATARHFQGDNEAAESLLHTGRATAARIGARRGEGRLVMLLGELANGRNDLESAERLLEEAQAILEPGAIPSVAEVWCNLGLLQVKQGKPEGVALLERAQEAFERGGRAYWLIATHLGLALAGATDEDPTRWKRHFPAVLQGIQSAGIHSVDFAEITHDIANRAATAGRTTRAREARTLEMNQWRGAGRETEAKRAESILGRT